MLLCFDGCVLALLKMREVRSSDIDKVHVVAHCVGGLAIHMAILGGFVPASSIASLTCTNSGMFFRVSPLARIKLWLPLIQVYSCSVFSLFMCSKLKDMCSKLIDSPNKSVNE